MNILIFNWRDIKNPESGGAEILTHELAKRLVIRGHEVTQFSAQFPNCLAEQIVDGVKIIRRGSSKFRSFQRPVHLEAYLWFKNQKDVKFDVVIDEIHGIPFFTPFYVKQKKVALICEVAQEIWDVAFPFPLNLIGRFIENNYFKFYNKIPFLAISPSTKLDLEKMGIAEQNITVLPMGLNVPRQIKKYPKEKTPTLLFVARLTKAKGIEDGIEVVKILKKNIPNIQLWVIGQGDNSYLNYLKNKINELDLTRNVTFLGFLGEKEKFEYMSRATLLIVPSVKEGWGLTVPEAGFVGTPAVGYDVAGLRDVIVHNKSGYLVEKNPNAMYDVVKSLISDKGNYDNLCFEAHRLALSYSWEKTAKISLVLFDKLLNSQ